MDMQETEGGRIGWEESHGQGCMDHKRHARMCTACVLGCSCAIVLLGCWQ